MPKYVIERTLPGAGGLTTDDLRAVSVKSNAVLRELGTGVQWVHSYVTDDTLFCVYNADDPSLIKEHARRGGFPCDRINQVSAVIDPVTGEA